MTKAESLQQTATLTIEQAFQQAIEHHQASRLQDAERLYRAILQAQPNHPDANHNLGVLAVQVKQPVASLPHFKAALEANPNHEQYWLSYIDTLLAVGSVEEAQSVLERGIQQGLSDQRAASLMARIRTGRLAAFGISDLFAQAAAHLQAGRFADAIAIYQYCIVLAPHVPESHVNLGNAFRDQGKYEIAIDCYHKALALHPDHADAYGNQGRALYLMGNLEEAIASCHTALRLCPEHIETLNTLGNVLFVQGKLDDAITCYRQALAVYPDFPKALHNLGNALQWMDQSSDSINTRLKFISLDTADPALKVNAAVSLAVMYYLQDDLPATREMTVRVSMFLRQTKRKLCNEVIYCRYLNQLLQWWDTVGSGLRRSEPIDTLYVVGESHALTYHNIEVEHEGRQVLCKARWIAGCKQWHLGNSLDNMQKFLFRKILGAIPRHANILLIIGEIDCRYDGGIMQAWKKDVSQSLHGMALETISGYLKFVLRIAAERDQKVIIGGVPATNVELDKLSTEQVEQFTGLLKFFNNQLREQSVLAGLGFLDLFSMTDGGNGISNLQWHIEDIHLRPDAIPEAFKKHYLRSG